MIAVELGPITAHELSVGTAFVNSPTLIFGFGSCSNWQQKATKNMGHSLTQWLWGRPTKNYKTKQREYWGWPEDGDDVRTVSWSAPATENTSLRCRKQAHYDSLSSPSWEVPQQCAEVLFEARIKNLLCFPGMFQSLKHWIKAPQTWALWLLRLNSSA